MASRGASGKGQGQGGHAEPTGDGRRQAWDGFGEDQGICTAPNGAKLTGRGQDCRAGSAASVQGYVQPFAFQPSRMPPRNASAWAVFWETRTPTTPPVAHVYTEPLPAEVTFSTVTPATDMETGAP